DAQQRYVDLRLVLYLENPTDYNFIQTETPKIVDDYQAFIRNLTIEDLSGSEGWYRLKEELLIRTNKILEPRRVAEVLISKMVIQ
ncbi:MAG: flagellar basal body-associated FliL family protein, partial [Pseudomonadota bacterium]